MDYSGIITALVKLIVLMMIGYYLNKRDILDGKTTSKLTTMILQVTCPALIISSVNAGQIGDKAIVIKLFMVGACFYVLLPAVSFLAVKIFRVQKDKQGIYQALLVFSNTSFMAFPVLEAFYGEQGKAAIFYCMVFHLFFNVMIYTYGVYLLTKDKEKKEPFQLKKMISPGIIASLLALLIFLFDIQIPQVIGQTLSMTGSVTSPLSMMILGSILAGYSIKEIFMEKKQYFIVALKLIIYPLCCMAAARMLFTDQVIIGAIVLSAGMPAASMVVMLAEQYGGQVKSASTGVILTTICSLVTLPFIYILFL